MTNYAIYRHEKIKSFADLNDSSKHNNRTAEKGLEHTNKDGVAMLITGKDDALEAWHEKAEAAGIDKKKLRNNAVLAIEAITTTSHDWWNTATPKEKTEWLETSRDFLIEKAGGEDNILSIHLHYDEETPHLHALSIPITKKEDKARGRPKKGTKDERPTFTKTVLSADHFVGGHRDKMKDWQTEYAASVAHLGLSRGIPKKETGRRNLAPAKYRAMKARETREMIRATESARGAEKKAVEAAQSIIDTATTRAAEITTTATERAEAFHTGLEAIDQGQIVYRPATNDKQDGLATNPNYPKDKPKIIPDEAGDRWAKAAAPFWKSLIGYAKRLTGIAEREDRLERKAAAMKGEATHLEDKREHLNNVGRVLESSPDLFEEARRRIAAKSSKQKKDEER
mgnify:CR=1 FL=1